MDQVFAPYAVPVVRLVHTFSYQEGMDMSIKLLDAFTAAQIAAGEVVERPASIVKELLENAIDAGSTEIRVELRGGGKREIRIIDNGCGIPADQVELAFQRHATSKLRTLDDLYSIHTLGFRGEALPAIATVAQVVCVTRTADAPVGVELRLAGGMVESRSPYGGKPGTTFIVRNLFFNAPVRLKFLKSDAAEAGKVAEIVTGYALAYPEISWTFVSDGSTQLQTPGSDKFLDVMIAVYRLDVARDMILVDDAEGTGEMHTRIHGYISRPTISKGTRSGIHLFVNRRAIKATSGVNQVLRTVYQTLLMKDRHPFAVLNIDIDPGAVDVNVHPAKTEVKFRFEGEILALLGRAIRQALAEAPDAPVSPLSEQRREEMLPREELAAPLPAPSTSMPDEPVVVHVDRGTTPVEPGDEPPLAASEHRKPAPLAEPRAVPPPSANEHRKPALPVEARQPRTAVSPPRVLPRPSMLPPDEDAGGSIPSVSPPRRTVRPEQTGPRQERTCAEPQRPVRLPPLQVIGQSHHRYILADGPDGLYVVDQHRAHERVIYERLLQETQEHVLPPHHILPTTVSVAPQVARVLVRCQEDLAPWGFQFVPGDTPGELVVQAVPAGLLEAEVGPAFCELAAHLKQGASSRSQPWREQALTTIACHSAVQAGQVLREDEMSDLLRNLARCTAPHICAHGRPTLQILTASHVEQFFG